MNRHKFIAIRDGFPGMVFASGETLDSLKQKLTTVDTFAIYEIVYTDKVEFSHTVTEVR